MTAAPEPGIYPGRTGESSRSGYPGFLLDPDALGVPCRFDSRPLGRTIVSCGESGSAPAGSGRVHARGDEKLVVVRDPRVTLLPVYRLAGRAHAVGDLLVRSGVADRLLTAADSLPDGFGFVLLDAWRPFGLQEALHRDAYGDGLLDPGFVSAPSADPFEPSPHLTGGAVDVSLTWEGAPLALGTAFDEFTDRAHAGAFEGRPGQVRDLRRLLHHALGAQGFLGLDLEWWHFEFGTRAWAEITGGQICYGPVLDPSMSA